MKLVLFDDYRPGVLRGDGVVDVSSVVGPVRARPGFEARAGQERMEEIIVDFDRLRPELDRRLGEGPAVPLSGVRLRAPLPRPGKVMGIGPNYREFTDSPGMPILMFLKPPEAVLGPGGTVTLPADDSFRICHHEAELTVVIGKSGRHVPRARAMDHVFGYTCGVDVSCRGDYHGNSIMGKCFDGFCPLGPNITTRDELDPRDLRVRFWVDGQPRHDYSTSDMAHTVAECIEYVSSFTTIHPGDVLTLGTNHQGIGPLQDGEVAEMEVEGIGRLTFHVRDPLKRRWPKEIDRAMADWMRSRVLAGAATTPASASPPHSPPTTDHSAAVQ